MKLYSKNGDDSLPAEGKHVVINGSLVYWHRTKLKILQALIGFQTWSRMLHSHKNVKWCLNFWSTTEKKIAQPSAYFNLSWVLFGCLVATPTIIRETPVSLKPQLRLRCFFSNFKICHRKKNHTTVKNFYGWNNEV